MKTSKNAAKLKAIYYNLAQPESFTGFHALSKAAAEKGISQSEVKRWLHSQNTYTRHFPVRKNIKRNRVVVYAIDELWQADLVELIPLAKHNNGYRYILTVIDVLSKYAWGKLLKTKSGAEVAKAFASIFKQGRVPSSIMTDKGKEFLNSDVRKVMKHNKVNLFTSESELKASVCERFNRTLKSRMWKYFTATKTFRYHKQLPKFLSAYNKSFHRSIQMTPKDVNQKTFKTAWDALYDSSWPILKQNMAKPKYAVGDLVRIYKYKPVFYKGYEANYTDEVFVVHNCIRRTPYVYKLRDSTGDTIDGVFYEPELVLVVDK
jgi:transposase InsO family protein